jgi:glycosyltransferase involved in cell wall biosynthesis
MQQPLVSVVIPVHNGAADIAKAIDSILAQTFRDFELIVVNDGSTDGTAVVLRRVVDARMRVIAQDHAGVAAAVNRGIAAACGKYVARLDHDDLARPERLAKQVAFLDANPGHAVVGTWAEIWTGDEPTQRAHEHPIDDGALQFELLFNNYFVHSSVMLRKSALDAAGGYATDPERMPEDYELWSRLARRHRVGNLPERLTVYREMPDSLSRAKADAIRNGVILISTENLAAAVGEPAIRDIHRDIAALTHGAYRLVSPAPDLEAMCSLIETAAARIATAATATDLSARVRSRIHTLRGNHASLMMSRRTSKAGKPPRRGIGHIIANLIRPR